MENTFERKLDLKLILSVIAAGLMSFTGVVVATAMNVTFPTLMKQFQIDIATVQWITTGYLLMLSIIIPLSSFLKKRFRMKQLFLFANIVFIIATVMCMVSPNFMVLLLGRLLQGIGAGIALPLMFNIVLEQAPFEKMGFMMGIASLIAAIAPAVGPSFGGLVVNTLGWRMIFAFLLPLLLVSTVLGIYAIRQSSATETVSFDVSGYLMLIISFICFIFAINSASSEGWLSTRVILLFLVCLAALFFFAQHTGKTAKPLINLCIFQKNTFTFSVLYLILLQFICLGIGFLLPNYSQLVMNENALTAGRLHSFAWLYYRRCAESFYRKIVRSLRSRSTDFNWLCFCSGCFIYVCYVYRSCFHCRLDRNLHLLCNCAGIHRRKYHDKRAAQPAKSAEC